MPIVPGLAAGAAVGCALALVLGGVPRPARLSPAGALRRRLVVGGVLVFVAAGEEAVFRRGILDALVPSLGTLGAVAASTVCFAAVHGPPLRRLFAHMATGACFGAVYVLSGRLVAAVAAHAAYNLVVLAGDGRLPVPPAASGARP